MKIETKYEIGQKVYFPTNFRPCRGNIEEVSIQVDRKNATIQYRVKDEDSGIFSGLYDEDYLYASLAELRKAVISYIEDIYEDAKGMEAAEER